MSRESKVMYSHAIGSHDYVLLIQQGVRFCSHKHPELNNHIYWRFGNFRKNFIFANSIKRHITDFKNSRLRQDLPISINDRVILPFREGLFSRNFAYAKFRENKVLAKISEFTVH